jgi:hypothetical protein
MSQMNPVHILLSQLHGTESFVSSQFVSAFQEIPRIFLPLEPYSPIAGDFSIHTQLSVLEVNRNIVSHQSLDLTICLFPLGFPNKTSYVFYATI